MFQMLSLFFLALVVFFSVSPFPHPFAKFEGHSKNVYSWLLLPLPSSFALKTQFLLYLEKPLYPEAGSSQTGDAGLLRLICVVECFVLRI